MSLEALVEELSEKGVSVYVEDDKLRVRAEKGSMTDDLKNKLTEHKDSIIALLSENNKSTSSFPKANIDLDSRYLPFPLTDIQQAYWIGRRCDIELGGISTYAYVEIDNNYYDQEKLINAWNKLIDRHDMLRAVLNEDGNQTVLENVDKYVIGFTDISDYSDDDKDSYLDEFRSKMSHQLLPSNKWPLFDIKITKISDTQYRLHLGLDLLIADFWSMFCLLDEWFETYVGESANKEELNITFRDYVIAENSLHESSQYKESKDYWFKRINTLPEGPKLPLAKNPNDIKSVKFNRRSYCVNKDVWGRIKEKATAHSLTPSGLLACVFSEALNCWTSNQSFSLNITLFNRLPLHEQVNSLFGDFTSTILLQVDKDLEIPFVERAKGLQEQLWKDLEHRYISGVQFIRELAHHNKKAASSVAPVVFTSTLGLENQKGEAENNASNEMNTYGVWHKFDQFGDVVYGISQTPQVWLDHQVAEKNGSLIFNWDSVDELFPAGLLDDMFDAYCGLLERLADDEKLWVTEQVIQESALQAERKITVNNTNAEVSSTLLHELFNQQIEQHSQSIAIIDGDNQVSYQALYEISNRIGHYLKDNGAQINELIAVVMEKGWQQIAGVFGVLNSGAAYLPLDPNLPEARLHSILASAKVKMVLTQTEQQTNLDWPDGITVYSIENDAIQTASDEALTSVQQVDDLAYVIYTSGSTGQPKGVMIDHKGAVNTLLDMNERFDVTPNDKVLGISSLSFDLSVYDVFGILSAGGTLILPAKDQLKDASHWLQLIQKHNITLWNSVPALMQMLVEYSGGKASEELGSLKNVWMSGDWIPLDLPDRIKALWPKCNVTSLGGATEASIWSIHYPIEQVSSDWTSIPYGKPLKNQQFYVLDAHLNPCPDWVPGELYIGGIGVAKGYWQDEEKTNASFIIHPQTKERLYKTGDLGRYLNDGNIEFLGREDFQVKVNGYRIELGEIEAAINQHDGVQECVVTAYGEDKGNKQLVAYIVSNEKGKTVTDVKDHQPLVHGGQIDDPMERLMFKFKQLGLRHCSSELQAIALEKTTDNDEKYLSRQSYREFSDDEISLTKFSRFIGCLSQLQIKELPLPKYRYPSAGTLYPVQTYLYVKAGRVEGVNEGLYYHDPVENQLLLIQQGDCILADAFGDKGDTNREIYEQCGFGIFLVADLNAIEPLYAERSKDFCIIEAGYMGQLLSEVGPEENIGVCAIGDVLYEMIAKPFGLSNKQLFVHSLLAGHVNDEQMQHVPILSKPETVGKTLELYLNQAIPAYMVPKVYVELDALPLTSNGKIDRKALPEPQFQASEVEGSLMTEIEVQVAELLCQLFKLESVSKNDNFFALGGDSLLATQLLNLLEKKFGVEMSMREFFEFSTVEDIAKFIDTKNWASGDNESLSDEGREEVQF